MLVAACLALVAAAACKKDKKSEGEGKGGGGGQAVSADLQRTLAMIPKESDGVIGIDLGKLRGSELYKAYEAQLREVGAGQLDAVQELCGFDPVPKLQRVIAGGAGRGDATAVVDGLGKAEVVACMQKAAAAPPPDTTITVDGDFMTVVQGDNALAMQFLDDDTAVIARRGDRAPDKAAMAAILAAKDGDGLTGSQPFMEMVRQVDTGDTIWFVVNGQAPSVKSMGRGFVSFVAAWGDIAVGAGLDIETSVRFDSDATAKQTAEVVEGQVAKMKKSLMKDMLGDVTVKHTGRDVRFHVVQSRDQLEKLVDFAGTMLGGMFEL